MLIEDGVPHWDSILIAEGLYLDREKKQRVLQHKTYSLNDFSERFEKLMSDGYSWINLCGLGLLENTLVVGIELPSTAVGSHFTSVNLAGPMLFVSENNYQLDKYLEIGE
jgi:hypothetical protein